MFIITFETQRLMDLVGEDSVVRVVMSIGSTPMDTITVNMIADLLQLRKRNHRHIVLFLGARAGGLFRNPSFYELIEILSSEYNTFKALQEPKKFDKCYHVLSSLSETDIHDILLACIAEQVARPENDALAQIVHEDVFDVVISTNIDPFVEEAFRRAGLREPFEYRVFIPGLYSDDDIRRPETQCALLKVFGDWKSRNYNSAKKEFVLDANPELRKFLESTLGSELLIVGYDPVWDAPIESAFPLHGRDCWYVNEELPAKNSHIASVLKQRQGKYLGSEMGNYREFIEALRLVLSSKSLSEVSTSKQPPPNGILYQILDRVTQTHENVLELMKRKFTPQ